MVTPQNQAGSPESDVFSLPAWRSYFRGDDRELGRRYLTVLLSIGGVLSVAALAGITWDARWTRVWSALVHADWPYILIAPVGVAVSHLGYTLAYRQVARTADGPDLTYKKAAALVTTGFGPLSPKGGFALDTQEFRKLGFTEEEAQLRVRTLGMLEYAVLAPAAFLAAVYMTAQGMRSQAGLTPSWIIGVPAGAAIVLGVRARYHAAGEPRSWWDPVRHALEGIDQLFLLLGKRPVALLAFLGMALYWAGDIAALGGCLDVFAHRRGAVAVLIVGYATGYALTRRSLPLGGAGIVEALLPFAMNWVGFPLAASVLAVIAYRIINLWLAMIPAVLVLRRMRE